MSRLLFLCTGNSARSQMAEALARTRSGGRVQAYSAGSRPKPLHPNAVRVMGEAGIDLASHRPKHLEVFAAESFDLVITLCDRVREVCPEFPGHPGYIHWSIADPAASSGSDEQTYPAFQQLAAELETRIGFLLVGRLWRAAQGYRRVRCHPSGNSCRTAPDHETSEDLPIIDRRYRTRGSKA